jgi:hypothetical protein
MLIVHGGWRDDSRRRCLALGTTTRPAPRPRGLAGAEARPSRWTWHLWVHSGGRWLVGLGGDAVQHTSTCSEKVLFFLRTKKAKKKWAIV